MKKIAFINPYFGKLPSYFDVFLKSCAENEEIDWLIFTDDHTYHDFPENVKCLYFTFEEIKKMVQDKFDFEIELKTPQKLCDYKCAYGYLFEEYLAGYDFWGYCDLDIILGKLKHFITEELLARYDKIFSLGHMSLYRNTYDNNRMFMSSIAGEYRYKQVFTSPNGCAFDEWFPGNINELYLAHGKPIMVDNWGADINSYRTVFNLVNYDFSERVYKTQQRHYIFKWDKGCLFGLYECDGAIREKEYPYVHLQKRKMQVRLSSHNVGTFCIIPNQFIDDQGNYAKLLHQLKLFQIINYQFFIVKCRSLKSRIKNGNWQFNNVFRKQRQ